MRSLTAILRPTLLALPLLGVLAGCTTEKLVYRDRDPFNEPVAAAKGFLGYYDVSTKQTTCGNCHAGLQASWKGTAHADAYATLPATAQDFCKSCHSVSAKGNLVSEVAGFDATKDSTYHDVQCESCHGPGLDHVRGVGQGQIVRPLAKVGMTGEGTCAECHSGAHHPFAEEWAQSGHAQIVSSAAANTSSGCASCHDGRKALIAWGENANYMEKSNATTYQPTTCSVCHDPHGSANSSQLRFPISSPDPEQNLCMKCHIRRSEPNAGSSYGVQPHAPQGAVLLGTAGYRPAGFVYAEDRIFSSHGSTANPKLCAGCHVNRFTVTDQAGGFVFQATGHLFRPNPCLDAQGKPTADKNCAYTATARSWAGCVASGCHANAAVAVSAFTTVRARMKLLTDQLWIDSNASGSLQAAPTDAGMLPTVRQTNPTAWSTADNMVSPAEGAEFNARLCGEYNQGNSDNSKGIHNPFLCEALLIASINEVRSAYGLPAPPAAVQAILDGPVGGSYATGLQKSSTQIAGLEVRSASQHR
ncbi:MAG: cytochrome c3 family protein [Gemmatimonadota bacterium]|nr:cytochrome c3 family protein [Gemmatimonadota bacterium]